MNPDHPQFEDLSAHHDGEAPEWAEHVNGCEPCQRRLGELATLTDAVAQAAPRQRSASHRDPVAHAIEVAKAGAGTPFGHGAGSGGRRRWALAVSAAAVLAISIGVGAVVASKGPHQPMTRDALSGPGPVPGPDGRATAGAPDAAAAVVVGGDLGGIADRGALVTRVEADLRAQELRRDASAPDTAALTPPAVPGPSGPAQGVVGTRPCEVEARGDPGDRGEVVYQATAEESGTPAVVLAFRSVQGPASITVEMRARSDCRLLLQGAIP